MTSDLHRTVTRPRSIIPAVLLLVLAGGSCVVAQENALITAVKNGDNDALVDILERDGNVNEFDDQGWTALMWAAALGHRKAVDVLLSADADLLGALSMAAQAGQADICSYLAGMGADVDEADSIGLSALHWAAVSGSVETVRVLLQCGANPNAGASNGATPLMGAASARAPDVVRLLVEAGAELEAVNADGSSALVFAASAGDVETVQLILEAGADIDSQNGYGWTALMGTAWQGHTDVARALLESGADPWIQTNRGDTALDISDEAGSRETGDVIWTFMLGRITFAGGDGEALETAVVIEAGPDCSSLDAVSAEALWVRRYHPDWTKQTQMLSESDTNIYDIVVYVTPDGESRTIYYDITGCYGFRGL